MPMCSPEESAARIANWICEPLRALLSRARYGVLVFSLAAITLGKITGCAGTSIPVESSIEALRQACEFAGAPDLDTCADLLRAEADHVGK